MRSCRGILLVVPLFVLVVGCGPGGHSEGETASGSASPKSGSQKNLDGPQAAVYEFLEAVRTGDDAKAEAMLTPLARERTRQEGLQVAPRGSDTARFEVGEVEYVGEDGACVASKWTDLNKDGQPRTDEMAWMLRKETEGWRIAGMAASVFEGEPPIRLNFENPKETLQKLEALHQEIARRATQEPQQAQRPEASSSAVQR